MNGPSPTLLVAVADPVVFVKITGRATFTVSHSFKTLIQQLHQKGYQQFVLELRDCLIMDSTFLGVLAGVGLKLAGGAPASDTNGVKLLNPNPRVLDLLENLGVSHFFCLVASGPAEAPCYEAAAPGAPAPTREEVSRLCLEAHQFLMQINPANVPKFKDVARFLEEDLAKLAARAK